MNRENKYSGNGHSDPRFSISYCADGLEQSQKEGSPRVEEEATLALGMTLGK